MRELAADTVYCHIIFVIYCLSHVLAFAPYPQTADEEKKAQIEEAYSQLQDTVEKKASCLETMKEITALEEHCGVSYCPSSCTTAHLW